MKMVIAADLSCSAVIAYIQMYYDKKTRSTFQAYHTERLEKFGIKRTRIEQAQKLARQVNKWIEGSKTHQSTELRSLKF